MMEQDIYDPAFVKDVFDRCSEKYITFSYIFSMGFTERWRKQCVSAMPDISKDAKGLDLMAGTGEVWPHLLKRFPNIAEITAVDISSGMHERAMTRLHDMRVHKIGFVRDDILNSDLPDGQADYIISTFGLKTFNSEQHEKLAKLIATKLKSGGVFSLIEASDPKGWIFRSLYLFHLKRFLPFIEKVFLRGATDFKMIGTYSTNFGDSSALGNMMREQGLKVEYKRYFFGCATGLSGCKP